MKLRAEIEPDLNFAAKVYPTVLKIIVAFNNHIYEKGDDNDAYYKKVVNALTVLTKKDIASKKYASWEYWEADGEYREAFKISLPEPKKVANITRLELTEIVERIKKIKLPPYLNKQLVQENEFTWEIIHYYHDFLALNFKTYTYDFFNRKKDENGKWYELDTNEIVDLIWGNGTN